MIEYIEKSALDVIVVIDTVFRDVLGVEAGQWRVSAVESHERRGQTERRAVGPFFEDFQIARRESQGRAGTQADEFFRRRTLMARLDRAG